MSIKTQGTHLYLKDVTGTEPAVMKFACPTGITGLFSGSQDEIDETCLDDTVRRFVLGLKDGGELSAPFIFDPTENSSHRTVFALNVLNTTIEACICLSDGTSAPTLDSNGDFVAPANRTSIIVPVLVKAIPIDIAGNEVVRGTLPLRVNGSATLTWADGATVSGV